MSVATRCVIFILAVAAFVRPSSADPVSDGLQIADLSATAVNSLTFQDNTDVALRAAWEQVRRSVPEYQPALSEFAGFVEGRLDLWLPAWWREQLASALAQELDRRVYPTSVPPLYWWVSRQDADDSGFVTVSTGLDQWQIPADILPVDGPTRLVLATDENHCYVLTYQWLWRYELSCFRLQTGEVLWQSEFDPAPNAPLGGEGWDYVEVRPTGGCITVLGAAGVVFYIYQFGAQTGEISVEFTTWGGQQFDLLPNE